MRDATTNLLALRQQQDLINQVFFKLDEVLYQQFTATLNAPPETNPGLERLLAVQPPWKSRS